MSLQYVYIFITVSLLTAPQLGYSKSHALDNDYCFKNKSCARGTTTILGTWQWDIDNNQLKTSNNADLWWQYINNDERELTPVNNARIKFIGYGNRECLGYGPNDIMHANNSNNAVVNAGFSENPVKDSPVLSVLTKDAILAVITNQGQLVRLCVRGFRSSHDFYFRESNKLDDDWKKMVKKREENRNYHMEVDWTIFKDFDVMPYMESPK